MTCASRTLRHVIAPAWRAGLRALVLCVLLTTPASAHLEKPARLGVGTKGCGDDLLGDAKAGVFHEC